MFGFLSCARAAPVEGVLTYTRYFCGSLARESVRLGTLSQEGGTFSSGYMLKDGSAMVELRIREKASASRKKDTAI